MSLALDYLLTFVITTAIHSLSPGGAFVDVWTMWVNNLYFSSLIKNIQHMRLSIWYAWSFNEQEILTKMILTLVYIACRCKNSKMDNIFLMLQSALLTLRSWLTTREVYVTTTRLEATTGNWYLTSLSPSLKCLPLHLMSPELPSSTSVGEFDNYRRPR